MTGSALAFSSFEQRPLRDFTEKSYLDYSMYVILDRALPQLSDGLKPVQRRIVYAMSELGLKATSKHKKSARTVGDVLGKFHPHGDSACYEAMVLMAQNFSYRYPLVDGQGNWGSPDDPKSFAAMRYTEARLSRYSELLLSELEMGTVDWAPNFDGTLEEPKMMPARAPMVLLNGTTGIAVGMATDVPPHNLTEVMEATIHLLDNPKATLNDLMKFIPAPDFPTEAEIITSREEIKNMYATGNGGLRMRAVYVEEENNIVITALPHQVSGSKIIEQIAAHMQNKKLPMIADVRDESDHECPTRIVLEPKGKRFDVEPTMSHLFATTDLEKTYRVNLNLIGLDGRPKVYSLLEILSEWLKYRQNTVVRRLQHRLEKVLARLHILDGLLVAFLNIDAVIAIIRKEEEPKPVLMKKFALSEIQAEAILDLKLRHLAKLEEVKIRAEQKELSDEREDLEKTLNSDKRLKTLMRTEFKNVIKEYGDKRRSPLVERKTAEVLKETERLPSEPVTVVLSQSGWIRAAKGHEVDPLGLSYKSGDAYLTSVRTKSNQGAIFMDSTGRAYTLPIHAMASARGQGEPITGKVTPPVGAIFLSLLTDDPGQHVVIINDFGYGFLAPIEELISKNKSGKQIMKLNEGWKVFSVLSLNEVENNELAIVTAQGRMAIIPLKDLPVLGKGRGVKLIQINQTEFASGEDRLHAVCVCARRDRLVIQQGKRKLEMNNSQRAEFRTERGHRGQKLPRGFQKGMEIRCESPG